MSNVHAAGILLTHGDRALFLKRSDKARDHAGEWCCPGGSLEDGETAEQAARREMQEETGLTGLLTGNLNQIDEGDGFVTFRQSVDEESTPTLNDEHTEAVWALLTDPPQPLHPGVAATLKKMLTGAAQDKREYDENNWYTVSDNPLSGIGVFEYSEASVIKGGDPSKMVGVYRSAEELGSQECVDSFKLMPWTDDHPEAMLGAKERGLVPPEEKGVHGVIGEQVYYKDGTLYGNIKVFSQTLARKISEGKRELSVGYFCQFIPSAGVFAGKAYQYVQRTLRGNHLASVRRGKMGDAARVMDAAECMTLSFALDLKEEPASADPKDATAVAGKVAAEKGMTGHDSTQIGVTTVADKSEAEIKEAADRRAARDAARSARDSARDSMSGEEEASQDAKESAEDASEEKEDEKDETKEAKDRKSARDRRAGARDARKSARDRSARDAKGKGMDAAAVTALVDGKLAAMDGKIAGIKVPTAEEIVAQVRPAIRKEEAAKASLYGRVSPIIGAFDHAEMTHLEMATYSLDKLGAPKGATDPVGALDFYLAGRSQVVAAPATHALDAAPAEGSFLHRYLNA